MSESTVEQPVAVPVKKSKVKKPKVMKQVKRKTLSDKKAKKFLASTLKQPKLVYESSMGSFQVYIVQFPDVDSDKFVPILTEMISGIQPLPSNPYTFDPTGNNSTDPEKIIYVQRWRVAHSDEALQQVAAFAKKYKFEAEGDIFVKAQMQTADGKQLLKMSSAKKPATTFKMAALPKNLKPYNFQLAGVEYILNVKKGFIADEMGLGKTVQAALALRQCKKYPAMFIVPKTLVGNWERELKKWLPKGTRIGNLRRNRDLPSFRTENGVVMSDVKKKALVKKGLKFLKQFDAIVVNYDRIAKWLPHFVAFKPQYVVFDESHYVKGNTARTRFCKELTDEIAPEYIIMMSGTPVMNRPVELIRQLQIMGRMQEFGGVQHFINRFCSIVNVDMSKLPPLPKINPETGEWPKLTENDELNIKMHDELIRKVYENQVELNTQLRSICYVRREKSDVLTELPDKTRTTIPMEITNRDTYNEVLNDVSSYLQNIALKDEKFLKSIKKLSVAKQIQRIKEVKASKDYKSSRAEALVKIETLKQVAAVGKLAAVKEWVENFYEENPNEKLVMFCNHKAIVTELQAMFADYNPVSVIASLSDKKRDEAALAFQSDKSVKMLIGTLKVAGVGITLTAASNVVFIELGWTPAVHDQAEDRCHRITQKWPVTAHYLLAENTIEEFIAQKIEGKRKTVDAVSFGDPLAKVKVSGSILGDIITTLTGKTTEVYK